ncbi:deaminase [Streptomonospora litoralis]|uniref:tRNA-specific adenosine deaminase n=1 Tax=Streptomonospora litoralis TaxID=2498135 RepID=A0A4P6PUS3_9ACTN|nr:deaminase [Streptomonospora litoralis]QBI51886.1 tRNA-specific adenosine deaminase [Streptomonospora litoralis]
MKRPTGHLETLLAHAVQTAIRRVETGGLPFAGRIVMGDGYSTEPEVNRVRETGDPSAHAEIVAMRQAMRDLRTADLAGATLLATGEPCGLCYRFAADHGVEAVDFAVDRHTAAQYGFDYRASYAALRTGQSPVTQTARHLPVEHGEAPFTRYADLHRP